MTPETAVLLARFRLAVSLRPDLLSRAPWYRTEGERLRAPPVTVDRWAAQAAGLPDSGPRSWYLRVEGAYREAARALRLPPSRVQAILWVAVRDGVVRWGPVRDDGIAFRTYAGRPLPTEGL